MYSYLVTCVYISWKLSLFNLGLVVLLTTWFSIKKTNNNQQVKYYVIKKYLIKIGPSTKVNFGFSKSVCLAYNVKYTQK